MIDIVSVGQDIDLQDTDVKKAANILEVQLGSLEYAPLVGVDLAYFLTEEFQFQNESFKSYLIKVLANAGINVTDMIETLNDLDSTYSISVSGSDGSTGFVAR